jgi:acylphosphatase
MGDKEFETEARLQAIVHGRVQGVNFRFYTRQRAIDIGVRGYVRNRWDGTVEVVAEGTQASLDELLSFLRVGPRSALVTELDIQWPDPTGSFRRFEVRY